MENKYFDFLKGQLFNCSIESKKEKYMFLNKLNNTEIKEIAILLVLGRRIIEEKVCVLETEVNYRIIKNEVCNELDLSLKNREEFILYIIGFSNTKALDFLEVAIKLKQNYIKQSS